MVPDGWVIQTIEDIAKVTFGGTPSRNKPSYWGGNIPWVTTTEVQNCKIYKSDIREYISEEGLKKSSAKQVPESTILLAMIGQGKTRGQVALLTFKATTNQNCASIIFNDENDPTYYFNYLLSQYEQIRNLSNNAGQSNLSGGLIKSIKVPVPPLSEQKKVAKILSSWDKAIETVEKLIENSCTHKKALMQQLLTGKKRFAGFEGEWKSVRLDSIANIVMGSSPKSSSYNEIGEGLPLLQGNADINNRKSCPRVFTSQVTKECSVGDILLSVRAPVGTVAISEHRACIGRGISSIKAIQKHSHEYLYQWLLNFEPKWERLSQGSTFEAVNSNDIKSLHLNVPCFKEQQKIASVLTNTDQEIELLEQQLSDLKQEKKALMQQLLTGKRRVTIDMTSETLC